RSLRIDLPPFTLIAATTRSGLITTPLRDRFGIPMRLQFYGQNELEEIIKRAAEKLSFKITTDGAKEIARRSRGTPRVAGRLLRRVRDFAGILFSEAIDAEAADAALVRLEVDNLGLDAMDKRYLNCIARNYSGGPVGVDTLAAALSEQRDVIEEVIEPYLLQQGFIDRTPRGRVLSPNAYEHLGIQPKNKQTQLEMLSNNRTDIYETSRSDTDE
ncbi:MAG: Holliday junction DNA helicase RuvB C-terminal domain-containing protein, partial [Pseudomonadota bacterium]|nr:Holliday junction DNA helicase RuvB C-terminal domain-containing protein [Pseudomonadota bacterium]